jgi:ribosomal protein S18 acetylase RimI-like enzyme
MRIAHAESPADLHLARMLFREYIDALGVDLSFQDVESELASLPGRYAPPEGVILLATRAGAAFGCGALRALEPGVCEMKRLYVRREARGQQLGRRLAEALMKYAANAGYRCMRLDTLASMESAHSLYASLGFRMIAPYTKNPLPGTQFLECSL